MKMPVEPAVLAINEWSGSAVRVTVRSSRRIGAPSSKPSRSHRLNDRLKTVTCLFGP